MLLFLNEKWKKPAKNDTSNIYFFPESSNYNIRMNVMLLWLIIYSSVKDQALFSEWQKQHYIPGK